ncbi:MAG: hypothetical protein OXU74_12945 [Gemmatimonadota bacterium]|nr:hypothetical protein [Gemmatimonadota bacterium]
MARHNREASGVDQRGFRYRISYQPDWLDRIRVTRRLPTGRQSTRTLFRNPARVRESREGGLVRTTIESREQDLKVEIVFRAAAGQVGEIEVHWRGKGGNDPLLDRVSFTVSAFR